MNESVKKGFSEQSIWLYILIAVAMVAALVFSAQVAPSVARAESEAPVAGQVALQENAGNVPAEVVFYENEEAVFAAALDEEDDEPLIEEPLPAVTLICNLIEDFYYFALDNADPLLVATAHYFSGYLGQLVFFGNWSNRRSGSFGRLMGLYGNDKEDSEIVKHEHGHFVQFCEIGLLKYIFAIAIPSILHDPVDYYSQPWEVTADLFGGVTTHRHSAGSEEKGLAYLENVKNSSLLSVVLDCFR